MVIGKERVKRLKATLEQLHKETGNGLALVALNILDAEGPEWVNGIYVDQDGVEGRASWDAFANYVMFIPTGTKSTAIVGQGLKMPWRTFSLREAHEQLKHKESKE